MNIGFTGTRQGLTSKQEEVLIELFEDFQGYIFHHGDCVGADAEVFNLAVENKLKTVAYPCDLEKQRAFTKSDIIMEVKSPLERNHDIVDNCDILYACPADETEVIRSGTWATIRYAKSVHKPIRIVYPHGPIEEFN